MAYKNVNFKEQRVGVFIDVQNMYYSCKNLYSSTLNFGEVLQTAVGDRNLIRAFAYVIKADVGKEQDFFDALESQGYEVRAKDLQIFSGGAKKGDWDVGLTIDAVTLAAKVDVVVLVTGDGDYIPLVRYLQNTQGCKVEVLSFKKTTSSALIESVDIFTDLAEDTKRFLVNYKRKG
ncbi:hypothetical protein COV24_02305 [candidate division WWE3 bacterium CG10_big_fil_rev_8_21_14_0_10_32_10]|uniref:NYN domain-containing protein n=1 Tax=candidate division WWE3 bacterium CG10_big_fil_rev_8_21_14_0_10_32_10 TaxID=1975090 RepID=A0A2H0RAN9_UNCKA|nr:MAG: hypothetical protein COV24_02305 [candidate division WWE3 bacterium CG10_big_fil_rev_8_21_14_0_10_32_10]